MIKIGDRELLHSATLLLKDDEEAHGEFDLPSYGMTPYPPPPMGQPGFIAPILTKFQYFLIFKSGASPGKWTSTGMPQGFKIECVGWEQNAFPSAMAAPAIAIPNFNGKPIGFFIAHAMCGPKFHNATIQFYLGGTYGQ